MKVLVVQKSTSQGGVYPRGVFSAPELWDAWRERKAKEWTGAGGNVIENSSGKLIVLIGETEVVYRVFTLEVDK